MQYLRQSFTLPVCGTNLTDAEYARRVGKQQSSISVIHAASVWADEIQLPEELIGIPLVVGECTCVHFNRNGWCFHER